MPREEVSFARGTKATMPQDKVPGRLLIATDTGEAYVDDTTTNRVQLKDTTKVSKSGDTMSGPLNMGSNKITNVVTPTADTDAANLGSVKSETAKMKYTGGTAITVDDSDKTISHNDIGTAGSVGPSADATPAPGGTFTVPQITTDGQGHVSSKTNRTVKIPQYSAGTGLSISGTAISHSNNGTAGSYGPTGNVTPGYGGTFQIPQITTNDQGHVTEITMRTVTLPSAQDIPEVTTYTGVSPITVSGTQISHNNIGSAGSVGPIGDSTATHGGTITIPYITVDAKGHVSAKENRIITLPAGPVNMEGASSSAAGSAGYVPAPAAGADNRYLRSDGTWAVPPDTNTTYTADRGLSMSSSRAIGHAIVAPSGNRGPTAAKTLSPGGTVTVPQIYYDAYGHVTSSTVNRTITLNSSILDTSDILTSLSGVTSNSKVLGAKLVADAINNLNSQVSTLNTKLENTHTFAVSDEIDTGETWVDGKKIYRRTLIVTDTISGGGNIVIPLSLTGIADRIWVDQQNSYIRTLSGDQSYPLPLPRYSVNSPNYVAVWVNSSGIRIYSDSGWNQSWEKCVTVRYTKV